MSDPMTLAEFNTEISRCLQPHICGRLRPLILRLLAGERDRIREAVPGGNFCDPQDIADMIRNMGDPT